MNEEVKPVLSIVILTYNEKADTMRCLASLFEIIDNRTEVILVDNGSSDGTVDVVSSMFQKVKIARLATNIGVGPGRNHGVSLALGKYTMILDNDTIFYGPEPVKEIERVFSSLPRVGVVGFQLVNEDGSIQRNFRRFPVLLQPFVARIGLLAQFPFMRSIQETHLMKDLPDNELRDGMEVDFVIGANQVFLTELFLKLGRYDEKMFYGAEDCEMCLRFKQHGYTNYYSSAIRIAHIYKRRSRHSMKLFWNHLSSFAYMFIKHKRVYRLYP